MNDILRKMSLIFRNSKIVILKIKICIDDKLDMGWSIFRNLKILILRYMDCNLFIYDYLLFLNNI